MSNRTTRFLMLWLLVALQAITPFVHAHAGAVQLDHAGFLHTHQGGHGDAVYHASAGAADDHGTEIGVAHGMPLRSDTLGMDAPLAVVSALPCIHVTARPGAGMPARPGAGMPAPPQLFPALPDHTLPPALAPPSA